MSTHTHKIPWQLMQAFALACDEFERRPDRLIVRINGYALTSLRTPNHCVGTRTGGHPVRLAHLPKLVLLAWQNGQPLAMYGYYWCGQGSRHIALEDPNSGRKVCSRCVTVKNRLSNRPVVHTQPTRMVTW